MNNKLDSVLLIDNSNMRTKLMFCDDNGELIPVGVLSTRELTVEAFKKACSPYRFARVVACSVVPWVEEVIKSSFDVPVYFLTAESCLNVKFNYKNINGLGADRVANVLGMVAMGRVPGIAVDLGTAITFEVVVSGESGPEFMGGAIAPGLLTMARALSTNTAKLPDVETFEECVAIATCTEDAVRAGCVYGCCGLVTNLLDNIVKELGYRPYVVATGGDSQLIASRLDCVDEIDSMLTFKGLQYAAQFIFSKSQIFVASWS